MTEFTEIMEQASRMCKTHGACSRCPLHGVSPSSISCAFDYLPGANFDDVERRIRAWAAEHPDRPTYPSWEEGWKQLFPEAFSTPCPGAYGKKYRITKCTSSRCGACKKRAMPAEIAGRLGIEPLAPKEDV